MQKPPRAWREGLRNEYALRFPPRRSACRDPYLLQPTIIVLNSTYNLQRPKSAKHIFPGKVHPTPSLVSYPDEASEAIAFVFNDTLICDARLPRKPSRSLALATSAFGVSWSHGYEQSGTIFDGAAPNGSGALV